ncbi:MAG: chemotaxis protein CheR [Myxococcales bacterium]|nr:chemotaxis protein CheR [Myxococcales bacterium]
MRRQVCKRVGRRMAQIEIDSIGAYRSHLESHAEEWAMLDACCRITISRFYRDRGVFEFVCDDVLPMLATAAGQRDEPTLRVLSIGAASGEEPYTAAILWRCTVAHGFPDVALDIVATDCDATMLGRADEGVYAWGSVKELPPQWRERAFEVVGQRFVLKSEFRSGVRFELADIREAALTGVFDLILCRNTMIYFEPKTRRRTVDWLLDLLSPDGLLLLGHSENLHNVTDRVRSVIPTVYQLAAPGSRRRSGLGQSLPAQVSSPRRVLLK